MYFIFLNIAGQIIYMVKQRSLSKRLIIWKPSNFKVIVGIMSLLTTWSTLEWVLVIKYTNIQDIVHISINIINKVISNLK